MHFGFSISKCCLKCQISRGRSDFYVTWHGRLHQGKKWHVCNMMGWRGGLARVQLCWILAKYSPLHHTSCSQIVHVRNLRFRLGGVSFLWHPFICLLVHCEIRFPLFIDTCMNFSIIFLKIWTDFWTLTVDRRVFSSWISQNLKNHTHV